MPSLAQPQPNEYFETPEDEWIDVNANVADENSIDRVEFYAGDVLFATKTAAPFSVKWTIGKTEGTPDFKVVAWDAAGNKVESAVASVRIGANK